jgi:prevent-host-death family protein
MLIVNMHEAKTQLSRLVEAAEQGETVVIARGGKPAVQLTALHKPIRDWSPEMKQIFSGLIGVSGTELELDRSDLKADYEKDLF